MLESGDNRRQRRKVKPAQSAFPSIRPGQESAWMISSPTGRATPDMGSELVICQRLRASGGPSGGPCLEPVRRLIAMGDFFEYATTTMGGNSSEAAVVGSESWPCAPDAKDALPAIGRASGPSSERGTGTRWVLDTARTGAPFSPPTTPGVASMARSPSSMRMASSLEEFRQHTSRTPDPQLCTHVVITKRAVAQRVLARTRYVQRHGRGACVND